MSSETYEKEFGLCTCKLILQFGDSGFKLLTSRKIYRQTEEHPEKKSKNERSYRKYGQ